MIFSKVIFAPHCKKHGLSEEDIVTAAEHVKRLDRAVINGELYVRFTGTIPDALSPNVEAVLKVTATKIVVIYHANYETQGFFDRPISEWAKKG